MPSTKPIGTRLANYASAKDGPFECEHCVFFSNVSEEKGNCKHPKVLADEQVKKVKGLAVVDAHGCCTYFRKG